MAETVRLTTHVGDELRQEFILRGSDGIAIDLTGATWSVYAQDGLGVSPAISAGSTTGQFYLTADMTDANKGLWNLQVQVTWPSLRPSPETLMEILLQVKGRP